MMKKVLICIILLISSNSFSKDWNVKTSPLYWIIGGVNGEVNYALDKFSVGVGGLSWSSEILDLEFSVSELHLRGDYWFNGAFNQGWFAGAQFSKLTIKLAKEYSGVEFSGSYNTTGYLFHFGHHWQWESFNISLATFAGVYDFGSKLKLEDNLGNSKEHAVPGFGAYGVEFMFGWLF